MSTTITFDWKELKVILSFLNDAADEGVEGFNVFGQSVDLEPFLKKILLAGLRSGDVSLPECFTADDPEIQAAAAEGARKRSLN